jgi:DNA mismatch repair ATPase MutS
LKATILQVPHAAPRVCTRNSVLTPAQPIRDIQTLNARLDALDELLRSESLFASLTQLLAKLPKVRASPCTVAC